MPRPALALAAAALMVVAGTALPWGNGASNGSEFRYYGVHDAITHLAWERLRAQEPAAAAFLSHWFLPKPGGYGPSFAIQSLKPQFSDNLLGYTDDPDSDLQDWDNHLYIVHPRSGHAQQAAAPRVAALMEQTRLNLTLSMALGDVPCNPLEHMAAFDAGLLSHYLADVSQWGHVEYTRRDHSHPPDDPDDRTYHGYYESKSWNPTGLRALLADQRARPWAPDFIADPAAAIAALATHTSMPDGVTVNYVDRDGSTVKVGSGYAAQLSGYVAAYDAGKLYQGMRGWTPDLWARAMANIAPAVDLLADLWWTAYQQAYATVPAHLPSAPPGPPGCSPT